MKSSKNTTRKMKGAIYKAFIAYGTESDVRAANTFQTTKCNVETGRKTFKTGLGRWIALYDSINPDVLRAKLNVLDNQVGESDTKRFIDSMRKPKVDISMQLDLASQAKAEIARYLVENKKATTGAANYFLVDCVGRAFGYDDLAAIAGDIKSRGFTEDEMHSVINLASDRLKVILAAEESARGL